MDHEPPGGKKTVRLFSSDGVSLGELVLAFSEPPDECTLDVALEALRSALALRRANLLEQAHQALVGAALAGEQSLFDRVVQFVAALSGVRKSACLVPAKLPSGTFLLPAASFGFSTRAFPKRGLVVKDKSRWSELLSRARPVCWDSPSGDKGLRRMLGASTMIAVPVCDGPEVVAVLLAAISSKCHEARSAYQGLMESLASFCARLRRLLASSKNTSNEVAEALLQSLPAGIAVEHPSDGVLVWGPGMTKLLGVPEDVAKGKPLDRLLMVSLSADSSDQVLEVLRSVAQSSTSMHLWQQKIVRADGQALIANLTVSPISRGPLAGGVICMLEDVTERAILDSDMERIRHLAHIGQFTAQIAHELRNPLTSIRGAAQILQQSLGEVAAGDFVRIILQEVDSLNRIADEFLDFAKPLEIDARPTAVYPLLRGLATLWRPVCREKNVVLRLNCPKDLPILWIDASRINQVLRNLVLNAVQAMPEGGRLVISASYDAGNREVVIRVKDSGMGMSEDQAARVFEPFFTTKPKGTGLGLSVAIKLVKAHGGSLELKSKEGKGTLVTVRLPVSESI